MKKIPCYLMCFLLLTALTGCKNDADTNTNSLVHNTKESSDCINVETNNIDILETDKDSIINSIDSYPNLISSDTLYTDIPQTAPVLKYVSRVGENQDFEKYYSEFTTLFDYIFPDKNIIEDYLFYTGKNSYEDYDEEGNLTRTYNLVKDYYEKLVSSDEGVVNLLYDESWYGDMTDWKSPVCLELGANIGYGYAVINKGKTVEISGKQNMNDLGGQIVEDGVDRYPILESFDPVDYFEIEKTYSPESEESYKLSDKECKIKDAVEFYENYINNLPYPENSNLETKVVEVDVMKVNEDTYGYYFLTSKSYNGVTFDYMRSGTEMNTMSDYSYIGGNAFMIESDDVDIIYGYYKLQLMDSIEEYENIVSFDDSLKTVSTSLTSDVRFTVRKIEFVYCEKPFRTDEGYIQTDDGEPREVSPSWKFTLYNPNDNKYYRCYVDATTGEFRYFTTVQEQ
jgi:hypothetical protein